MMRLFIVVFLSLILVARGSYVDELLRKAKEDAAEKKGKIWAVLVAGSSGWMNYRHQSDVCHLYHLLTKNHGIPRQNVVVMMVNDIAYNEENKFPGTIINAMHGKDVYEGTMIDYMGNDVTPENFLKILRGESMFVGSRKTLNTGPKDHIFVNFVDHGGPGVLGFPRDELHLEDLNNTLYEMHNQKRYGQMLWYVEACFSGSMFESLPADMNITAHTAANSEESSYACVFDDDIGVYLGDCWSLNWMNNTEQIYPRLYLETVEQQYKIVKNMTVESHPMIFGDLVGIYHEKLSLFLGHPQSNEVESDPTFPVLAPLFDPTPTPDVMLETLRRNRGKMSGYKAGDLDKQIRYHEETEKQVQVLLEAVVKAVSRSDGKKAGFQARAQAIRYPSCNKDVLSMFYSKCWKMQTHPYVNKYIFWITNLCNTYNTTLIVDTVRKSCTNFRA